MNYARKKTKKGNRVKKKLKGTSRRKNDDEGKMSYDIRRRKTRKMMKRIIINTYV